MEQAELSIAELNQHVEESLVKAYRNGELNEEDKALVVAIWEQMQRLAK